MTGANGEEPGPMQAAQRAMRSPLPKRFYKAVSVGEQDGFAVLLDGKPVKTPLKRPLAVPVREIAEIVAQEWDAQTNVVDPAAMPMTRLVNAAIDRGSGEAEGLREEVVRYAASDLVVYRAAEPEGLAAAQKKHWDPVVRWARETLRANFIPAEGVKFAAQPETALAAVRAEVQDYPPPFALTALAGITQITGSALIALMLGRGDLAAAGAWAAAQVDEDWNVLKWGEDAETAARRAGRRQEFEAAARLLALTPGRPG